MLLPLLLPCPFSKLQIRCLLNALLWTSVSVRRKSFQRTDPYVPAVVVDLVFDPVPCCTCSMLWQNAFPLYHCSLLLWRLYFVCWRVHFQASFAFPSHQEAMLSEPGRHRYSEALQVWPSRTKARHTSSLEPPRIKMIHHTLHSLFQTQI